MWRDTGDRFGEADTLTHLGDTYQAAGDPGAADRSWRDALAILDALDHPDAEQVRAKLRRHDDPPIRASRALAAAGVQA